MFTGMSNEVQLGDYNIVSKLSVAVSAQKFELKLSQEVMLSCRKRAPKFTTLVLVSFHLIPMAMATVLNSTPSKFLHFNMLIIFISPELSYTRVHAFKKDTFRRGKVKNAT